MTLDAVEFIRRFLLHILPAGFVRIRQYGFLANRARREKLELCRALLGAPSARVEAGPIRQSVESVPKLCPACGTGHIVRIGFQTVVWPALPLLQDSS